MTYSLAALAALPLMAATAAGAETLRVDVASMPRVVFTGDSQTCGCVGAWDYPQMLSWEMPVHVLNTAVGGSNTSHLLDEKPGGTVEGKKGEKEIRGHEVSWFAGPFPGVKVRLGKREYVIDRIAVHDYKKRECSLFITEPLEEDFAGTDYAVEPGWRVRIAEQRPAYVCYMWSVNDTGWTREQFLANLKEIVRRTRALGAQPIFLTGVPLMVADKGGSHPGDNVKVDVRANDLVQFCRENGIPCGDIFHALMLLDEQSTSAWVDTVHPTTDGSQPMLLALRAIFGHLGLAQNPYFLRGYRLSDPDAAPDAAGALVPIATSQPRRSAKDVEDVSQYDIASIRVRDEYGLLAAVDGQVLRSDRPLVFRFGVGDVRRIRTARLHLVTPDSVAAAWFDWAARRWVALPEGTGDRALALPAACLESGIREGALTVRLTAAAAVGVEYAGLVLEGDLQPYQPRAQGPAVVWPAPGQFQWSDGPGNLLRNGGFTGADGESPAGWHREGADALYQPQRTVAEGSGDFISENSASRFQPAGADLSAVVRPLDMLEVVNGPAGTAGRYLLHSVAAGILQLRRPAKAPATGVTFRVRRWSGCGAVPGGAYVETRGESAWRTELRGLVGGKYRLSFFYRAYDPANMKAKGAPAGTARVEVHLGPAGQAASAQPAEPAYHWQRHSLEFTCAGTSDAVVRLGATGNTLVQYTGVSVEKAE